MVFMAGHLVAQSSTITSSTTVKNSNETKVSTQNAVFQSSDLPGFPVYQNTGNKEVDDTNYGIAKENWIKENKVMYDQYVAKLSGSTTPTVTTKTTVSKSYLDTLSEDRKKYVLDHPELYIIE